MPFINTKVNMPLTKEDKDEVKARLGQAITAIPGKSEQWLMVGFEDNYSLYFKGSGEGKMAFVEVKVFGRGPGSAFDKLTGEICGILKEVLGISPDKVYVKYEEVEHWGWNGSNF